MVGPDALFSLLFTSSDSSYNHIVKGGVLAPDAILNENPVGGDTDYLTSHQKEQQKLMMPPPPPGSFKKIIAHPTRTLLTVPANFDERTVQNSSRPPNYSCVM